MTLFVRYLCYHGDEQPISRCRLQLLPLLQRSTFVARQGAVETRRAGLSALIMYVRVLSLASDVSNAVGSREVEGNGRVVPFSLLYVHWRVRVFIRENVRPQNIKKNLTI